MSVRPQLLSAALPPLLLSLLSAIACELSAGPSLGVFVGGVLLATLLVPPLVIAQDTWQTRLIALWAILVPFWLVWLYATLRSDVYVREWLASCIVLTAYATLLAGVTVALRLTRLPRLACSAIAIILGLAWLTWPIYMSPSWEGTASAGRIAPLITLHPALAINGQLFRHLGLWTEQSIAYHLTDLSQNVPYTLPRSILPCLLFHGLIGAALVALSVYFASRAAPDREGEAPSEPRVPDPLTGSHGGSPSPPPSNAKTPPPAPDPTTPSLHADRSPGST